MEVSFFAGIAGKKTESVEVGTLVRVVYTQPLSKGKQSSAVLFPVVHNVGWEAGGGCFIHI